MPPKLYGTSLSARCSALLSTPDFNFSDSSIIVTIFSKRLEPPTSFTRIVSSPSSTTVPAYAVLSSVLRIGTDSPVKDAWLTIASPFVTTPSNGMTLPICTTISSPASIWVVGTKTSCPSLTIHTLLTFKDIVLARSSTDFLWVHSSSSSPMPSMNMIEPAVLKSLLKSDTPIAVASNTGTSIFPAASVLSPFHK